MPNYKTPNPIRIEGDIAYIPLTQGKEAIVCAGDAHLFQGVNWHARKGRRTFYASSNGKSEDGSRKTIYLHHLLLPKMVGFFTDHVNGDGLDNRRENLRYASPAENSRNIGVPKHNTSGFKGVTWLPSTQRWIAQIRTNGKLQQIGQFKDIQDAAFAYRDAAQKLHGEFARWD